MTGTLATITPGPSVGAGVGGGGLITTQYSLSTLSVSMMLLRRLRRLVVSVTSTSSSTSGVGGGMYRTPIKKKNFDNEKSALYEKNYHFVFACSRHTT